MALSTLRWLVFIYSTESTTWTKEDRKETHDYPQSKGKGRLCKSSLQLIKEITKIIIKKKYLTVWLRRGRPGLFSISLANHGNSFLMAVKHERMSLTMATQHSQETELLLVLLDYYCALIQLQVLTGLLLSSSIWPFFDSMAFDGLIPSDNCRRSISSRKASMSCWLFQEKETKWFVSQKRR